MSAADDPNIATWPSVSERTTLMVPVRFSIVGIVCETVSSTPTTLAKWTTTG